MSLSADQSLYAASLSSLNQALVAEVRTNGTASPAAVALRVQIKNTLALYVTASQAAIDAQGPGVIPATLARLDSAVGGAVSTVTTGVGALVGDAAAAIVKPLATPLLVFGLFILVLVWMLGKSGTLRISKAF